MKDAVGSESGNCCSVREVPYDSDAFLMIVCFVRKGYDFAIFRSRWESCDEVRGLEDTKNYLANTRKACGT